MALPPVSMTVNDLQLADLITKMEPLMRCLVQPFHEKDLSANFLMAMELERLSVHYQRRVNEIQYGPKT